MLSPAAVLFGGWFAGSAVIADKRLVPHAARPRAAVDADRGGRLHGHVAGAEPDPGGGAGSGRSRHGQASALAALVPHREGVAFLVYLALGHLPAVFALPAGLGDLATAIAAPLVARRFAQAAPVRLFGSTRLA
jgi:hypothetical protein